MPSTPDYSRRHSYRTILVLAVVALMCLTASAHPRADKPKPYALLFGTMWGPDQRPLPGITIYIRRAQDKKPRWTLRSDNNGEFAQRVPPGKQDYVVWAVIKQKKKPTKVVETKVHVDNEERVDFGLHLTE